MKKLILIVFSLVLSYSVFAGETATYNLYDAVQKKLVKVIFKGRGFTSDNGSSHYGKCISLNIKNISSQRLELKIEAGRKLKCFYDTVQDMMISKSEMFALGPGGSSDFTINAFCTQKHEHSPGEKNVYSMEGMAGGYLYELALLIESLDCHDNMGQQAVWVLTDDVSPDEIKGGDAAKAKKLKSFVEFAISKIKADKIDGYVYDYSFPDKTNEGFKITGEINWSMPYSGTVTLSVYDNKGKKVLDIFTGLPYKSGFQIYSYEFTNSILKEGDMYWLRIEGCGQRLKELAITMK